jgi:SnoaL-like domain
MNRREAIIAGIAVAAASVASAPSAAAESAQEANPELDQVRTLLRAHDDAFTNHDMEGVLACYTEKAAIMGSGPGEIWSGSDEMKAAYEHFFEIFDKGEQKFEYQFRIGKKLASDMGWMCSLTCTG